MLVTTESPILSLDVSPRRDAGWCTSSGPRSENSKGQEEFRMFVQPLAGGPPQEITLRAAEQVVSPAF